MPPYGMCTELPEMESGLSHRDNLIGVLTTCLWGFLRLAAWQAQKTDWPYHKLRLQFLGTVYTL